MRYVGQIFNNEAIDVDSKKFERCTFNQCKIVFNGRAATEFSGCTFNECQWVFNAGAEQTLHYLTALYHGLGQGGSDIVEAIFDSIRQGGMGHGALEDLPVPAIRR